MPLEDISNINPKRKEHSEFTRGLIIGFHKCNRSYNQIAQELNMPVSTIQGIIKAYNDHGVEKPCKRTGRPKVFTERTKMAMIRTFRAAPFAPISLQHQHFVAGGMEMSRTTFDRKMKELGFGSYSPAKKPALTDRHKVNRLKWCQDKADWTLDQWKSVVWSDESRFMVAGNDGGIRVVRKEGERYLDQHILHTYKFGKGSVMVWGCFWAGGIGPLKTLTGNIDQDKYVDCLASEFLPWYEEITADTGKEFLFQEDGATCHTGAYATWYKKNRCDVDSFDFWPAQSPDLNPIEHLWAYISYKLRSKRGEFANAAQLESFVRKTWNNIPPALLENLVSSMPDRCRAVIENNGGQTKY